ncbi:hypothetical protein VM1G_09738 [Cytospora mali]|uniref:Uncharacterized protein n=1 Tax=Cytospora mali TaxID=578113 RepID=A0A194WDN2_CYTMA|nr:hypothetical protein VM1G_09738 [Valsa mali]
MQLSFAAAGLITLLAGAEAHLWSEPAAKLIKPSANVVSNYTWTVTGWSAGCAHSGCYADFNVSAEAWKTSIPAFKAYCSVGPEGAAYQSCKILDDEAERHLVAARLEAVNTTGTGAHLAVSYEFVDPNAPDTYWNYTAYALSTYNQAVSPLAKFSMTPSEIWGVA